ncbi:MAG: AMP-binding protein [Thermodesulfobacteriota bacterium]
MATTALNFRQWFEEKVDLGKDFPFIRFKDKVYNYAEVDSEVNRVANAMMNLGITKGSKVAIMMNNCPEFIFCWFGLAKIGAVSLFVNVDLKDEVLRDLVDRGDAEYVILTKDRWSNYSLIRERLQKVRKAICVPNDEGIAAGERVVSLERICQESSPNPPPEVLFDNGQPMGFIHTSGTTGLPKWTILSHKAYLTAAESLREWTMTTHKDIFYDPLPLFHINPQTYFLLNALAGNASVVISEKYSASGLWKDVCNYKATILVLHAAPLFFALKQPVVPEETQHQVRMIAIAAQRPFMERFQIPVGGSGYGSTELPGYVCTNRFYYPFPKKWDFLGDALSKFAGKPVDYIEVKIFDEDGSKLPTGKIGEIVVRGREPHVIFDGYYNMPEKNQEVFRGGWFHTGDAGRMDEDGHLIFEGRRAESINVKGEWVPIEQVEDVIRSLSNVAEVAIVGVPAEVGQDVKAYIQVSAGGNLDPVELLDYCQTKLPRFMIPRYIEFIEAFPRTLGTEKIQKEELKKRGIGEAWDREKIGYKLKR